MTQTKKEAADVEAAEKKEKTTDIPKELKVFIEAGVQFGHLKRNVHPGMFPYIFGVRNNIHIIDVAKTSEKLDEALELLKKLSEEGKTVLFVGTKLPMRSAVQDTAESTGMPYIVNRWFGGTLTNWSTISERIAHLKDLKQKKGTDEWKKYPKHERMEMDKEIKKLEHVFGGIENMEKLPDAVFIADAKENHIAAKEAKRMKIMSIGIIDTNVNPTTVDHAIPANDDAITSVSLILEKVKEVLSKKGKPKKAAVKKKATASAKGESASGRKKKTTKKK